MPELEKPNNPYNLKEFTEVTPPVLRQFKNPKKNLITYSWNASKNKEIRNMSHKICGHNFEAFELLERYPNSLFLIPDSLEVATRVVKVLYTKYKKEIVDSLLPNIIYGRPTIVTSQNIIICDGQLPTGVIIRTETLRMLLCSKDLYWAKNIDDVLGFEKGQNPTIQLCYDERLQYPVIGAVHKIHQYKPDYVISLINYKKDLNFNLYIDHDYSKDKSLTQILPTHTFLIYATGNCRDLNKASEKLEVDTYQEIIDEITNYDYKSHHDTHHENYIKEAFIIGINDIKAFGEQIQRFREANINLNIVMEDALPIDNLFYKFDTYIYTPTAKNWDCSSRLIPECKKYNKDLILTKSVRNSLNDNLALKYRILDYYGMVPGDDISS